MADSGKMILNTLREYWLYKNQRVDSFNIPEGMPVLQSIMSFFVKPLGFDQIERYMMIKSFRVKLMPLCCGVPGSVLQTCLKHLQMYYIKMML